jgi:hypothetical protein
MVLTVHSGRQPQGAGNPAQLNNPNTPHIGVPYLGFLTTKSGSCADKIDTAAVTLVQPLA